MINRTLILLALLIITISSCKKIYMNPTHVVINEIMPVNNITVTDQDGEYDDWIELFNTTSSSVNLSGYYLSDSGKKPWKWKFPQGTTVAANGYLIIWADEDTLQNGLHANFKLSAAGESIVFSDPDLNRLEKAEYPAQTFEKSWARFPNGTGDFSWRSPTFNKSNGSK